MAKSFHLFSKDFIQTFTPTTLSYAWMSKILIVTLQLRKLVRRELRKRLYTFKHQI